MIGNFRKNTSKIPVDNGSSFNIPITIKIDTITNIKIIDGGFPLVATFIWKYITGTDRRSTVLSRDADFSDFSSR
jgi:hypothetical protein